MLGLMAGEKPIGPGGLNRRVLCARSNKVAEKFEYRRADGRRCGHVHGNP